MSILSFDQFKVNEDATADLIQQKNSLSQQINDLQKKLLDVQAQIVSSQQQTLAQNPQTQIPMGESFRHNSPTDEPEVHSEIIPAGVQILAADYDYGDETIYVHYRIPENGEDVEVETDVPESEFNQYLKAAGFTDDGTYDDEYGTAGHSSKYHVKDRDEEGYRVNYFDFEQMWRDTHPKEKKGIIEDFLKEKGLIG